MNINYVSISSNAGESTLKGLSYGANYGNLFNLTIDPNVENKMQSNSKLKDNILKQVTEQMSSPIPYIPGIKVASASAIVHSDGSVSGYIVGQPDESTKKLKVILEFIFVKSIEKKLKSVLNKKNSRSCKFKNSITKS